MLFIKGYINTHSLLFRHNNHTFFNYSLVDISLSHSRILLSTILTFITIKIFNPKENGRSEIEQPF